MNTAPQWPELISKRKMHHIFQLIYANTVSDAEREKWLNALETATEDDADEIIESLSNAYTWTEE